MRSTLDAQPFQPLRADVPDVDHLRPAPAARRAHVERALQPEHVGHAQHRVLPEVLHVLVLALTDDVDGLVQVQPTRHQRSGRETAGPNTIGNVSSERIAGVYTSSWPSFTVYSGMRRCHSRNRDPQLEARKVRAEAAVHAATERVVRVHLAVEAHLVGVGQRDLVGVDGTEADAHHVALRDRAPEDLGVLRGDAHDAADRCLPAQQLLHRRRHQRRIGDDLRALLGVLAQVPEEAVERCARRCRGRR